MIQCYFGKKNELSNKWMVRAMNFGQDRPKDIPTISYKMILEVNDLNDWSKTTLLEIKEDAQIFPEDWGMLGQLLLTREETDFTILRQIDINIAHEFAFDFAHDILIEVEKKIWIPCALKARLCVKHGRRSKNNRTISYYRRASFYNGSLIVCSFIL